MEDQPHASAKHKDIIPANPTDERLDGLELSSHYFGLDQTGSPADRAGSGPNPDHTAARYEISWATCRPDLTSRKAL